MSTIAERISDKLADNYGLGLTESSRADITRMIDDVISALKEPRIAPRPERETLSVLRDNLLAGESPEILVGFIDAILNEQACCPECLYPPDMGHELSCGRVASR